MELRHYRYERITRDPAKCAGKPCVRGLRMPVQSILSYLGSGLTNDQILQQWPELELEDIHQSLSYAAEALDEEVFVERDHAAA